jgi:hypothetical protein
MNEMSATDAATARELMVYAKMVNQRLGQFLDNVMSTQAPIQSLFFVEDDDLVLKARRYMEQFYVQQEKHPGMGNNRRHNVR